MKLDLKEQNMLKKFADIVSCHWFELATDDYGEICVFDKDENKKVELWEGIYQLFMYNSDVTYLLDYEPCVFEFFEDSNGKIKMRDAVKGTVVKASKPIEDLIERYKTVDALNNLFTAEERKICEKVHERQRFVRRLSKERLAELLYNCLKVLNPSGSEYEFSKTKENETVGIRDGEYRLLKKYLNKE